MNKNPGYLIHMNKNHDPKTGRFTFSAKNLGSAMNTLSTGLGKAQQNVSRIPERKKSERQDISHISDQELNRILNRERMEREYDRYFNTPTESKGRKFIDTVLPYVVTATGIIGTAALVYNSFKGDKK